MDRNGHVKLTRDVLHKEIRKELNKHFKSIDNDVLCYITDVIDSNQDDFSNAEDIQDAIGAILGELATDGQSDDLIEELCTSFLKIMTGQDTKNANGESVARGGDKIQKLLTPVVMGNFGGSDNNQGSSKKGIFDIKKEDVTYVDQKRMEKVEAKLKQKQDKRAGIEAKVPTTSNVIYDASKSATASQAINKKTETLNASESNRNFDITIQNFDVAFGNKVLLTGADLQLAFGRRYCLIGRNGIGKTTLLKMIASGQLKIAAHIRILHVEQEVIGDETLAIESVLECDFKRNGLLAEEKAINEKFNLPEFKNDATLSQRLSDVYQELEAIEADKAPSKAAKILCGLGFETSSQKRATKEFSGGWRMRLALARALFAKPDLLLLDEPTNMLDLKAIIWLENYLETWESTLLIVSHDRSFLNSVATDILHLNNQQIVPYRGNYENFLKTRNENLKNQQREYEAQLEYRQHIQIFIDRFRYNANRASQVQSKIKLLEKLPELVAIEKEKEVHFKFPEPEYLSGNILSLDEVDFYYTKDKFILRNSIIAASMDSRICIVGENGSGKTTLLKILLGDLSPIRGMRNAHRALRIGYFTQHHIDALNMNISSLEYLQQKYPSRPQEEYRGELGKFGVSGDMALQPIISLSGGQKSRVAFTALAMQSPNFFILDEPTNHLDMETIEALGEALSLFKGGIILVSHDERLITLVCNEMWLCRDQKITSIPGGYDQYRKLIEKELEF